ncbi:GNAT family N-acetyltransferase [Streptomyces sp. NPDC058394]|uniref:GNAT family N-acetyltransferase n=1 Tax=Streptomyces sp. NPDC058394 TaxID=3346477 RepID=UPI00365F5863
MDGVTRTVRDEVLIRQIGLIFNGYSRNLETGRQFNFEGRIVNDKHLTGTYQGEQREDESVGVFHMALDLLQSGRIEGLWAGYGAESRSVNSGKWSWRKMAHVTVAECSPGDPMLPGAVALLNDSLGFGYLGEEELQEMALSPEGIVLVALNERRQIVGAATGLVMDGSAKEELEGQLNSAGARRVNLVGQTIGMLKSVAVLPRSRGQGIGLRLVNERLSRLKGMGCSAAVVLAWDSGSKSSSIGVLESAGFKRVASLAEYWRELEGQETFDCAKCGRPCVCSAIVLKRSLYDFEVVNESPSRGRATAQEPRPFPARPSSPDLGPF